MMERRRKDFPFLTFWPDHPPENFLSQPRRQGDLLAHWEWMLWNTYLKADIDGRLYKAYTDKPSLWNASLKTWAKTFWERLSTCTELIRLCREQSSLEVHRVLIWLFWFSDMVERKTIAGAFGFQQRPKEDRLQQIKRTKRIAVNLETVRKGIARIPDDYFSSTDERGTLIQRITEMLHVAQARAGPGPSSIVIRYSHNSEEDEIVLEPTAPATPTKRPGKTAGTGGDLNLYLALLVDLIEAIPGQQKHEDLAMSLLHHFTPPRFQKTTKPFNRENLRLTVHTFKQKPAIATKLAAMRGWLDKPKICKLCPAPTFLLETTSPSVTEGLR